MNIENKHLTLDQRIRIRNGINNGEMLKDIAVAIGKDPRTVSREIRRHREDVSNYHVFNTPYACATNMVLSNDGDILMVMDGASSGKVYDGKNRIVSSIMARIDTDSINKDFLYWYLKSKENIIAAQNTGYVIPHTDKKIYIIINCTNNQK